MDARAILSLIQRTLPAATDSRYARAPQQPPPANRHIRPQGPEVFVVLLTQDGGSAGGVDELGDPVMCSYTYTLELLDDETLLYVDPAGDVGASGMTPAADRLEGIEYWSAGEDRGEGVGVTSRYGLACRDLDGNLVLLAALGEIPKTGDWDCEVPA